MGKKAEGKEKMINKKLLKIFKNICKANDFIIKNNDNIIPMCFMIGENYAITQMVIIFKNHKEKIIMKNKIKEILINSKIKGYIFLSDTVLTQMNKGEKPTVQDCVVRTLYTPKGSKKEFVFHKNKKILEIKKIEDFGMEMQDEWDLWGKGVEISEKDLEKYKKFKEENKELYKEVEK